MNVLYNRNIQSMKTKQAIKDWFNSNPGGRMYVNCKYQTQVSELHIIKKLLREGFLVQKRCATSGLSKYPMGWLKCGKRQTYLEKA